MKLLDYLLKPETNKIGKVANVIGALGICLLWVIILKFVLNNIAGVHIIGQFGLFDLGPQPSKLYQFVDMCVIPPLWEELCWRFVPISIGLYLAKKFNDYNILIPIIIGSSINFGWGHGNGEISVLLQGVMGFVFACVYIKNGFSYWSSVTVHFLWNSLISYGLTFLLR